MESILLCLVSYNKLCSDDVGAWLRLSKRNQISLRVPSKKGLAKLYAATLLNI